MTAGRLRHRVLSGAADVAALVGEWRSLPPCAAAPCPSAGPQFLMAWLETLGAGAEPRVVEVRRDGRLVGVVPLVARSLPARAGGRQVSLAGSRRPPVTNMADVRVLPGEELAVASSVAATLEAAMGSWDTLYLGNVAATSRTLTALMANVERRGWAHATRSRAAAVIETAGGWDDYRSRLGRNRRGMPRRLRRLRAMGAVRVELALTGPRGRTALDELIALYRRRWGPGNWLDDGVYGDFLHYLRDGLDPCARMAGIWIDGRPLALQLIIREGRRDHALAVGVAHHDAAARESPGTLLQYLLCERAFGDDTTEIHLLHTVTPEKLAWATRLDSELTWIALSPSARPAVAAAAPLVEAAILARRVAAARTPSGAT